MKLELEFKSVAKNGLPEKSGNYFVVCKHIYEAPYQKEIYAYVANINYSAKHKAFNAYDEQKEIDKTKIFNDVVAYCEVPQEWFDNLVKEI